MPSAPVEDTLLRQWEILKLLPHKGAGLTATQIWEHLQAPVLGLRVGKRQVERDLNLLSRSFPILCNNKSRPYGWRWADDAIPPISALGLEEAQALRMVELCLAGQLPQALLQGIQPWFAQARKKLQSSSQRGSNLADKFRFVPQGQPLLPPVIDEAILQTVLQVLAAKEQIRISYQSINQNGAVSEQILHPLALINRGAISYLLATTWDYPNPWLYAVHRIVAAQSTQEPARTPKGFDLNAYIAQGHMQFGQGRTIRLQLQISTALANLLQETPLASGQSIKPLEDDWHKLTATVQDTWQLRWWLLGCGQSLVVQRPLALKREIFAQLRNAAASYPEEQG